MTDRPTRAVNGVALVCQDCHATLPDSRVCHCLGARLRGLEKAVAVLSASFPTLQANVAAMMGEGKDAVAELQQAKPTKTRGQEVAEVIWRELGGDIDYTKIGHQVVESNRRDGLRSEQSHTSRTASGQSSPDVSPLVLGCEHGPAQDRCNPDTGVVPETGAHSFGQFPSRQMHTNSREASCDVHESPASSNVQPVVEACRFDIDFLYHLGQAYSGETRSETWCRRIYGMFWCSCTDCNRRRLWFKEFMSKTIDAERRAVKEECAMLVIAKFGTQSPIAAAIRAQPD